ncbi:MAG: PII-interacting protein PipX family protein, partial [Microcoleaceae cyanobacterium]
MNHPNFGLLYRICTLEDSQELFTTLYAQRLFFLVTAGPTGIKFEPITR